MLSRFLLVSLVACSELETADSRKRKRATTSAKAKATTERRVAIPKSGASISTKVDRDREQRLKEYKLRERAFRSSKRSVYHAIPEKWGNGIWCEEPLASGDPFVVALASDEEDPLPIFAVINSTLSNAAEPHSLSFVVLVSKRARPGLAAIVRRYFTAGGGSNATGPRVSVCVGLEEQLRSRPAMRALAVLANSSRVKRKELLSAFNFAAFYLPHVVKAPRILYVDSDVIVRSDVGELAKMPMNGKPAAAVEDCTQHIFKYIDFQLAAAYRRAARVRAENLIRDGCGRVPPPTNGSRLLASPDCEPMPRPMPPNDTCVFNRGVLLLNRDVWLRDRLAEHIERHVIDFVHARGALFRSGVSQPPFLLALATNYERLDGEWNVRGLGRDAIGIPEWHDIAAETRRSYPGFVDFEHDLLGYMRIVAKSRRDSAAADASESVSSSSSPRGLSWREQLLESRPLDNPTPKSAETSYSILAALDAPPGTHRGAERPEKYKNHYPYVCPFAAHAKILHFNGEVKPWRMSARTVTHAEPSEGAICLWRDVSHARNHGHRFNVTHLLHGARHYRRNALPWCDKSVSACISSCALDWHRYVAGYVADLRRQRASPTK
ncbi:hypothetical protein CTAYLR_002277 [Chrysophaeum taylorii]|uniref:Hexosyltransferase n=1 Tax=Chrysophaeum taylorii TaxID=2483200 RepID=A0AAD7UN37_9STRA|nr:hypothetical protein CTAYLR_002277 [Chrysophaeum taylorii]